MLAQQLDETRNDDGVSREDIFRRATFDWARSTKRLVESSAQLADHTRVAYAALVDIEYARDLLDRLFIPLASKVPAGFSDKNSTLTAQSVKDSVSGLAERMSWASKVQAHVDDIVGAPPIVRTPEPKDDREWLDITKPSQNLRVTDLSAPVWPKKGKMLWAAHDCPVCPSKAGQRCQKDDGGFLEKPHQPRKDIGDKAWTA